MNCLFKYSLENKLPIDLIYMNNAGELSHRGVIVRKITVDGILAFDIGKQQLRSFKRANILSAAKQRRKRGVNYA
ncbi:hypothetical protein [Cytobacillus oceanisediminis]|uniref:Uncharacterized protein n=1 Tax=Cytobacillus oceanisediminis TaxID=665099 RepID=A0ABX3CLC7_9BACI|nr:hypothetical protein [Cytobacillus oceanisediminis]OHX43437.1 hypothetical protein BBV17_26370 [Cytobacillus oceanisediminis]